MLVRQPGGEDGPNSSVADSPGDWELSGAMTGSDLRLWSGIRLERAQLETRDKQGVGPGWR